MISVYFASKLRHADKWRDVYRHGVVRVTSRWIWLEGQLSDNRTDLAWHFWLDDFADVALADVVLVYGEEGDELRGALVEAGAALAAGKPVLAVGDSASFGTWQYHPLVSRHPTVEAALHHLQGR